MHACKAAALVLWRRTLTFGPATEPATIGSESPEVIGFDTAQVRESPSGLVPDFDVGVLDRIARPWVLHDDAVLLDVACASRYSRKATAYRVARALGSPRATSSVMISSFVISPIALASPRTF